MSAPEIARQTPRRRLATRLRYIGKPGTMRLSRILEARDWPHAVMAMTGTEWGGDFGPPFAPTLRYPWQGEERVFANNNDGFELWFGYPDHWEWHIGSDETKRLTRYLIVDYWLKSRWLGLRRPIYYAALHRAVNRRRNTDERGTFSTPAAILLTLAPLLAVILPGAAHVAWLLLTGWMGLLP